MTSIKTRIETGKWLKNGLEKDNVEEWHPLKQGLKLIKRDYGIVNGSYVEEWHPLKQGLKQNISQK